MARPGPKLKPPELVEASGTTKPCRARESVVQHIAGDAVRPAWVVGRARKIWETKVETYLARGQSVKGCEEALAQYVSLEAALIEDYWKKKTAPPAAMLNTYKSFAIEFYDTPASQIKPSGGNTPTNPFSRNGKR